MSSVSLTAVPSTNDVVHDVVIIGAGVMGSACAYRLSCPDPAPFHPQDRITTPSSTTATAAATPKSKILVAPSVLVIEQQSTLLHSHGSSHGSSRIIRKTYPQDHYTKLMHYAYQLWHQIQDEAQTRLGGNNPSTAHTSVGSTWTSNSSPSPGPAASSFFHITGGLDIASSHAPVLQDLVDSCERHGVEYERLTARQVQDRFPPWLLPDEYEALFQKDAGVLEASKAVHVLQQLAMLNGVRFQTGLSVRDIRWDQARRMFALEVLEKKEYKQKEDEPGYQDDDHGDGGLRIVLANSVVVTAGAWSGHLLSQFSVTRHTRWAQIPLRPKRTGVMYWDVDRSLRSKVRLGTFPVFIDYETHVYSTPAWEHLDWLKVCYHDGPFFEHPQDRDEIEYYDSVAIPAVRKTLQYLPGVGTGLVESDESPKQIQSQDNSQAVPKYVENCMYTMTPDEDFVVDYMDMDLDSGTGKPPQNSATTSTTSIPNHIESPRVYAVAHRLILGTGFSGHGFKFAPLIGDALACFARGQASPYDLSKLSASREFGSWENCVVAGRAKSADNFDHQDKST